MNSGSPAPADPVDCPKGQAVYDQVVNNAGCSAVGDTLACLRGLDYPTLLNAANTVPSLLSYSSVALPYLPRPDGKALTESPELLAESGKYAAVPFIIGDQEDEGTIFSLFQSNITNTDELISYLQQYFFHDATADQVTDLVASYPHNAAYGSPFRTGVANNFYPEYKRLAAILEDATLTLTRRIFLKTANAVKPDVKT
jgi:carboxylesterase type B